MYWAGPNDVSHRLAHMPVASVATGMASSRKPSSRAVARGQPSHFMAYGLLWFSFPIGVTSSRPEPPKPNWDCHFGQ